MSMYQRCPPNQAMIVFGGLGTRIIKSGGTPVYPFIEQRAYISLEVMKLTFLCKELSLQDKSVAEIEAVAQVKVPRR